MPNYVTAEPHDPAEGRSIWSAVIEEGHQRDSYGLYVLTPGALHWAIFGNEANHEAALAAVRNGGDPRAALGRAAASLPLAGITRAEKRSFDNGFSVKSQEGGGGWEYVHCPDRLARKIFKALQERCRPRLRMTKKRQRVLAAALEPLGILLVVWLVTFMLWAGALTSRQPPAPGGAPRFRTRSESGARFLGSLVGPTPPLVLGGLASVGIVVWGGIRVFMRGPFKKVLYPSPRGGEAVQNQKDEEDQDEAEREEDRATAEEPSQPLRAACTACGRQLSVPAHLAERSVRCPGCQGVVAVPAAPSSRPAGRRPQAARKVGLLLGVAALVLGALALALGLFASVPGVVLAVAVLGLLAGSAGAVVALRGQGSGPGIPLAGGAVNLLALIAAVASLLVSPGRTSEEDDRVARAGKEPAAVAIKWGEPLDPDGDCTITPQGNTLTIRVPPTPHDILAGKAGKSNAPRVLREVEGDFRVQVKVCGSIHPVGRGSVPGRLAFQTAGLLVWSDQDNFLRLVRTGQLRKGAFESIVAFRLREWGRPSGGKVLEVPDRDFYLRLERKGQQFHAAYRRDGQQWVPLGTLTASLPAKVRVGVMALNTVQERLSVRFEDLHISR